MLSCYRVLDLSNKKGFFCGKLLGDLGADVIKIEKPGGDPSRNIGPFYHDIPDAEKSLYWFAFNVNKRGVTLDIETADGQELFKQLVEKSDVVIESFEPGYLESIKLGYKELSEINPSIVLTRISPFGQEGPYRTYKAGDLVVRSLGGMVFNVGEPDRPPLTTSYPHSYLVGAAHAAIGTMVALFYRAFSGKGQVVDAPVQMGLGFVGSAEQQLPWILQRIMPQRQGRRRFTTQMQNGDLYYQPILWRCKDGDISFSLAAPAMVASHKPLIEGMKEDGIDTSALDRWDWMKPHEGEWTKEDLDAIIATLEEYFQRHTKAELLKLSQEKGVHIGICLNVADALAFPQFNERGFWTKVEHPELETTLTYPGAFVKFSESDCGFRFKAPRIGEHNQEIYETELGLTKQQLLTLKQSHVI
ncbi:MAG: CoA transferase [Dehalococcoidia bacterium]|jgi:crotonobetainyl-CoA:carnitine CoA-transferase CaiB-like acyl-CoA transferase